MGIVDKHFEIIIIKQIKANDCTLKGVIITVFARHDLASSGIMSLQFSTNTFKLCHVYVLFQGGT